MPKLDEIKNLENMGYEAFHIELLSDGSIEVDFIKTMYGATGEKKTIYIPVSSRSSQEYMEILNYLAKKYFVEPK